MRFFIAAMLVMLITGCADKPVTPPGIIPPEKMEKVMYDLMRTGEFLSGYVLYKDTSVNKTGESLKWYNKVWELHKVSEEEFRKSYLWYKDNPKVMSALMDSIMVIPTPALPKPKDDSIHVLPVDSVQRKLDSNRQLLLRNRERMKDSIRRKRIVP